VRSSTGASTRTWAGPGATGGADGTGWGSARCSGGAHGTGSGSGSRGGAGAGVGGFGSSRTVAAVMAAMMTPTMTTTSTELTRDPILPSGPGPTGATPTRHGRAWLASGILAILILLGFLVAVVPIPYVSIKPGSATMVGGLVHVQGAPSYPPKSSVAFTTVTASDATLLDALRGWLDDTVQVFPEKVIRGDQSRSENLRYNAQLMDTSKLTAETVALERLGHAVTVLTSGTVVRQIGKGTPAAKGLKLDDVIVAVDGEPVDHFDELRTLLQVGGPGAGHTLTVERPAGSTTHVQVPITTVAAPATASQPARAVIGIVPEERIVDFKFPFDVRIDSGSVGGPSAGLAFTLAVLDVLTPGELTGGHRIAVTGTMSLDGTVGPVGGAVQKAVAVRKAGYVAFLVPRDEYKDVQATVGHDLRVIPVGTLQDALDALKSLGGNVDSLGAAGAAPAP
jgi:PDZ domain-containing protein